MAQIKEFFGFGGVDWARRPDFHGPLLEQRVQGNPFMALVLAEAKRMVQEEMENGKEPLPEEDIEAAVRRAFLNKNSISPFLVGTGCDGCDGLPECSAGNSAASAATSMSAMPQRHHCHECTSVAMAT